jgi:hypothetical protein
MTVTLATNNDITNKITVVKKINTSDNNIFFPYKNIWEKISLVTRKYYFFVCVVDFFILLVNC